MAPNFRGVTVCEMVADHVARVPHAPAVRDPRTSGTLTYAQLWSHAGELADELAARGIGRGDIVATRLGRSIDLVVALLGVLRSGAAYLCLDVDAPAQRCAYMLDQARAALVIEDGSAAGSGAGTVRGLRLASVSPHRARLSGPANREDTMYVAYTSGSTGQPKGVVIPHRAVQRLTTAPNFCSIGVGDQVANMSNPAFDALTFEIWSTLVAGATIVVFPLLTEVTVARWRSLLVEEMVTTMFMTTAVFHMVARERPEMFGSVRTLLVGGELLQSAVARKVLATDPPAVLHNMYGPTEATTFATYYPCTEESLAGVERVPVGFPVQETTLRILDADLRPVRAGDTGELCIGGPGLASGYIRRPDLTAERFVTEPATGEVVYRTGDLARMLPTNAVEFLGRQDRQVKLWGFRIELEEIEIAVATSGLVTSAAVEIVGRGPEAMLVGFVVPHGGDTWNFPRRLSSELRARLPEYMVPSRWVALDELPVGPTGKVDRTSLRAYLHLARSTNE